MSLKHTVMSGLKWSAGLRFLGQLFTWSVTIVVIRLLSPGDYGLMALAGVFIAFLGMVGEMGLGSAIIRHRDLQQHELQNIYGFVLLVGLVLCAVLMLGAPLIATFYGEPLLKPIIWALSLIFVISGFAVMPQSLLYKELQYKKLATVDFIAAIISSVCTLILALSGAGVWSLVGGFLAIRFVSMCGYHYHSPYFKMPKVHIAGMGKVLSFGGQVTLARILWYFYTTAAATLIIGKILGKELLGIYDVALFLACLPMEKVGGMLNQVAFPAFSTLQGNPEQAGAYFIKAVRVLCFITIPVFWGISSISPEIIMTFLGEKWMDAIIPMQIIALVVPLRMIRNLMLPALLGMGRADVNLYNDTVAFVIMPLAFLVATNWGLIGVSLIWVLVFPITFMLNLLKTVKVLKISSLDVLRQMIMPICSGVIMYASIFLVRSYLSISLPSIWLLALYIITGAVAYMMMTLLFDRATLKELMGLVRA